MHARTGQKWLQSLRGQLFLPTRKEKEQMLRLRRGRNVRAPEAAVAVQGVRGQLRVRTRQGTESVSGLHLRACAGQA